MKSKGEPGNKIKGKKGKREKTKRTETFNSEGDDKEN